MGFSEARVFKNEHEPGSRKWEIRNRNFFYYEIHYQMEKLVGNMPELIERYNAGAFAASGARAILV